jgi:hypothetical protein
MTEAVDKDASLAPENVRQTTRKPPTRKTTDCANIDRLATEPGILVGCSGLLEPNAPSSGSTRTEQADALDTPFLPAPGSAGVPRGIEREELLRRARQADTASHIDR